MFTYVNVCSDCMLLLAKQHWIIISVLMGILMVLFLIIFFVGYLLCCSEDCFFQSKVNHHLRGISDKEIDILKNILRMNSELNSIFERVNLIRPVGSENHGIVKEYIKSFLTNLQWNVEEDRFAMDTVIGVKEFTNVIGTQDIRKSRRLILACHYDSLNKEGFYTSTDSAMPCSLMLSIAQMLTPFLQNNENIDVSLQLVFFDGEEAFISWSKEDSLYGSRHLADLWHNDRNACFCSKLHAIDSLVLLDLLGASEPRFFKFDSKDRFFDSLRTIEKRLRHKHVFSDDTGHPYFQRYSLDTEIQDDHVPFMQKDVPYIHLIAVPFPIVWHKINDNAENINWEVSKDLEMIFSVFIVEFFHLIIEQPHSTLQSNN